MSDFLLVVTIAAFSPLGLYVLLRIGSAAIYQSKIHYERMKNGTPKQS
jgi:hypothetical protein